MKKQKVFVVSLHKTGTTSLTYFLEKLGYLVTGPDTHLFDKALKGDYDEIDSFLKKFDAFQDDPWYMIYPYLYDNYPDSKFIFLKRATKDWIKSVQSFYGRDNYNNKIRRLFYGNADSLKHKELYIEKYLDHNEEVKNFFKENANFIEIDIKKMDDAIRLQHFLGKKIKYKNFPHKNITPKNNRDLLKKKIKMFVLGWFGLKKVFKSYLRKNLSKESYLKLRSKLRLFRAKIRVYKTSYFK